MHQCIAYLRSVFMNFLSPSDKSHYHIFISVVFLIGSLTTTTLYSLSIFFREGYIGVDSYFHVRLCEIYDFWNCRTLPWMSFTIYSTYFPDHHFLYHLLLGLFNYMFGEIGVKVVSILLFLSMLMVFYILLRKENIKIPIFWVFFLTVSSTSFILRMSMIRIQVLSLTFLLLYCIFVQRKKYLFLLVFSVIYTWTYSAYVFIPLFSVFWVLACYMANREIEIKAFLYTNFGILIGIVFNIYFPNHIPFLIDFIHRRIFFTSSLPMVISDN